MGNSAVTPFSEAGVRGLLHRAAGELKDGLVITHGAGGNANMRLLVAVAEAFAQAGICVLRCDLPFRQKRPFGPPHPSSAQADRDGLREAALAMRKLVPGRVFLGGQSYGGRQASMLAADTASVASALLLLSYPLHPPGRPEQQRTGHLPRLNVPCFFVHGKNDPFASSDELVAAVELIPGPTRIAEIEKAGHDLAQGNFGVESLVVEPFLKLVA